MNVQFLLIFLCSFHVKATRNENNSENDDVFVPTREWQVVKQGQKIPKGLHVRINFENGVTEAKILDETQKNEDKATAVISKVPIAVDTKNFHSVSEIKEALQNIKNEDRNAETEKINNQFKSYEELTNDLNIRPRSDNEILAELVQHHKDISKKHPNDDRILTILEDLEFLLHQIDNANDFVQMNGFQNLIYTNLNSTNLKIKESSLNLFGCCVQNNAKVQIHALETGALGILLKVLALNSNYKVKSQAVFALGTLLRHFPLAQLRFVENGGLSVFGNLLQESGDLKLRLKIVTLVNDLLLEHRQALLDSNNVEKLQQYDQIRLQSKLGDHNWCRYVGKLLIDVFNVDLNDHDLVEKALDALVALDNCDSHDQRVLGEVISNLKIRYKSLIDSKEDYFEHLLNLCNKALDVIKYNTKSEL
ncbi:hypothetical protein FQR65_LT10194 [Abscondita terminalis]|nr:hypothetical protein FQR65_LT10194 [Abscondita terminalis]